MFVARGSNAVDARRVVAKPAFWRLWAMAARPRTLALSVAPIAVGSAWAWRAHGAFSPLALCLALAAAIAIQIAANLVNDAADAASGVDGSERLGPPRITALGFATPAQVWRAAIVAFSAATLCGAALALLGGWPILAIGAAGMIAAAAYSTGPLPLSRTPVSELFVLAFFGVASVSGMVWLHAGAAPSAEEIALGLAIGAPAASVLLLNNHRDRIGDAAAGRRTLAILIGPDASRKLYCGLWLAAFAGTAVLTASLTGTLGALIIAPAAAPIAACCAAMARTPIGAGLNGVLGKTLRADLWLAAAVSAGLLLG